jgi:hypothetical protein
MEESTLGETRGQTGRFPGGLPHDKGARSVRLSGVAMPPATTPPACCRFIPHRSRESYAGANSPEIEPHGALTGSGLREVNAEAILRTGQFAPLHGHPHQVLVFVVLT